MRFRRQVLAAMGTGLAVGTMGCLGGIPFVSDAPIEFAATPPSVPDAVLDRTGYEEQAIEAIVIERPVEVAGLTQEFVVTNWQAKYDKAVSLGAFDLPIGHAVRAATFAALTTPQARLLGRVHNPVAEMDSAELVEMVQDRYAEIDNVRQVSERAAVVAGVSTVVGEFEADAVLVSGNIEVDLAVYVSEAVASGSDLIVAIGAIPAAFNSIEAPHLETLMEAIEHGG